MWLVHLLELGNLTLVAVWQAPDDSLVVLGALRGEVGWIWSHSPNPAPALLDQARLALVSAGYRATSIRPGRPGLRVHLARPRPVGLPEGRRAHWFLSLDDARAKNNAGTR